MNGESLDIKQTRLQKLKELFPELFAENQLDWEKLRAAFGDDINPQFSDIIFYSSLEGNIHVEVFYGYETFWHSQKRMTELFGVDVRTVNEHLKKIFKSGELNSSATVRKIQIVQKEGERDMSHENRKECPARCIRF